MAVMILSIVNSNLYIIQLLLCVIFLIFLWFRYKFSYWTQKGVIGPTPVIPYGNIKAVIKRKDQIFQPYYDSYFKYKHLPYVGMYCFVSPVLSINDPEVIKLVLFKEFDHFSSHGTYAGGVGDPLAGHLFNKYGSQWKSLRTKMSPAFSSGRLKAMYPLVERIARDALDYADSKHENGESINFSDLYDKYAMEIVGSVGFGIDCNTFQNPNSQFYIKGREYFNPTSLYWTIVRVIAFFAPDFFDSLKIKRVSGNILDLFHNLAKKTVDYRENNSIIRNDFLQALIELKNGKLVGEKVEEEEVVGFSFTMQDLTANAMLYMLAGYETSATTGQFAAYELALNPEIQEKARAEVVRVLEKHNGECTYEAQNEMVYLNMVLDETMRKYPPLRALFRKCVKECQLGDLLVNQGTMVMIPIQAIHLDPDIYPEPQKFDPERFTVENKSKRHPCHWMPFGEGPRKCLGLRQGYIQSKLALVKILHKYKLLLDQRTPVPMRIKASSMAYAADGGVWIKLQELNTVEKTT